MTTPSLRASSGERRPRFWREALIVLGIVAFGLFALGLQGQQAMPEPAVRAEPAG